MASGGALLHTFEVMHDVVAVHAGHDAEVGLNRLPNPPPARQDAFGAISIARCLALNSGANEIARSRASPTIHNVARLAAARLFRFHDNDKEANVKSPANSPSHREF